MRKIDLGQSVSILANVGVIIGIAFVAIEISQNNDQLAAQAKNTLWELRAELERDFINNDGGIAELRGREALGEHLSSIDLSRLQARRFHVLRTFEYMFQASPEDIVSQAPYMIVQFAADPMLVQTWQNLVSALDSDFVAFVEANVLPELDRIELQIQ